MDQSSNTFAYSPIDSSKGEIRLIRLCPATDISADVYCELFHHSLGDTIDNFETISYAWGDANNTSLVYLDGQRFSATVNLVSALRYLRRPSSPRVLWIDALCIDQRSLRERGEQVAMMGRIYRTARRNVLWLGEDTGLDEDTAALLKRRFDLDEIQEWHRDLLSSDHFEDIKAKFGTSGSSHRLVEQLSKVFDEPRVWQRIWVVQEVALANSVLTMYGTHEFEWWALYVVRAMYDINLLSDRNGMLNKLEGTLFKSTTPGVLMMREISGSQSIPRSLLFLWDRFSKFSASDSRDHVFALLALSKDEFRIRPNYAKSPKDLICDVSRLIMRQMCSLDLLHIHIVGVDYETTHVLKEQPSWTPRFGVQSLGLRLNSWPSFSAGTAKSAFLYIADDEVCKDPSVLTLRGLFLDSLSNIPIFQPTGFWDFKTYANVFSATRKTTLHPKYFNGEEHIGAYLTTCLLGKPLTSLPGFEDYSMCSNFHSKLQNFDESIKCGEDSLINNFLQSAMWRTVGALFGVTSFGCFAMLPPTARIGDTLCVLYGARAVMVLRKVPDTSENYLLVGPAYVHGFMYGEAVEMFEKGLLKEQDFNIV